jgi:anti-sigma regulatory factor (Ser/Thr protein kinase)
MAFSNAEDSHAEDSPTLPAGLTTLQLLNRLSELEVLSDWVAEVADGLGLSAKARFRLDLVLAEAVTNVIENAYTDDEDHRIILVLEPTLPLLTVHIADDGQPFNPLDHPDVVQPQTLEEAQIGGLGIHLIRRYAADCRYERRGQENCFTILLDCVD